MKKKVVSKILMIMVAGVLLTGCSSKNEVTSESQNTATVQTDTKEVSEDVEDSKSVNTAETTSVDDFVALPLDDGTVKIDSYKGSATEVVIPDNINGMEVSEVGGFSNNEAVTSVVIPDTVKAITDKAFINCTNLQTVELSNNLQNIGAYAFCNTAIKNINLPDSLIEIGDSAFVCRLEEIIIPASLNELADGIFLSTDLTSVIIPSNIKSIGVEAFSGSKMLKEVTIEDGVESIGEEAFERCTSLEKVTIPNSVTEIQDNAFRSCGSVTIVTESGSAAESYANSNGITCEIQ